MIDTPHETDELRPFTVLVDGQPTTTGVETCVTLRAARPGVWLPAVVRDGKTLVRIAGLARGVYRVWARVTRGDETVVLDLGLIEIS